MPGTALQVIGWGPRMDILQVCCLFGDSQVVSMGRLPAEFPPLGTCRYKLTVGPG